MGVTRGGSSVGSKLPMVTEGEAVPQEGQEVSGRYLRVPEDVLEVFWTSGSSGWLPELLDFWTWLGWTLLLQLDVYEQSTNLTVQ